MFGFPGEAEAWWQTRGMARLAGVNLPQAVLDGWLTRDELGALVARCEDCSARQRCGAWLAQAAGCRSLPAFCPNKPALEALAPQ